MRCNEEKDLQVANAALEVLFAKARLDLFNVPDNESGQPATNFRSMRGPLVCVKAFGRVQPVGHADAYVHVTAMCVSGDAYTVLEKGCHINVGPANGSSAVVEVDGYAND